MDSECVGEVPSLFVRLNGRFNNLRNHLNNYMLAPPPFKGEESTRKDDILLTKTKSI